VTLLRRCAMSLWLAACLAAPGRAASETVGQMELEGCRVILESERAQAAPPYLRLRHDCVLSVDGARAGYHALLSRAVADDPKTPEVKIYLGRMVSLPWLSAAVALKASRSPLWDGQNGRPRAGSPNAFVVEVLNTVPALTTLFEGWSVARISVEKVLVSRAEEIAALEKDEAATLHAKLPFDAMVWLTLHRAQGAD